MASVWARPMSRPRAPTDHYPIQGLEVEKASTPTHARAPFPRKAGTHLAGGVKVKFWDFATRS